MLRRPRSSSLRRRSRCVVYGWIEAGWLRTRVLEVPIDGLPEALDGLRIGHLSDFHLGAPLSRGNRASARAVAWVAERRPDLVCVTGDLVSHPRGERACARSSASLDEPFVVLGQPRRRGHARPVLARRRAPRPRAGAGCSRDEAETVELRGGRVTVVGVDPETYRAKRARPHELADPGRRFRLLLCHFPGIVERMPAGVVRPDPRRPPPRGPDLPAAPAAAHHARAPERAVRLRPLRDDAGRHARLAGHGTTFVPFRFFARPEVTELVLRVARRPPLAEIPALDYKSKR